MDRRSLLASFLALALWPKAKPAIEYTSRLMLFTLTDARRTKGGPNIILNRRTFEVPVICGSDGSMDVHWPVCSLHPKTTKQGFRPVEQDDIDLLAVASKAGLLFVDGHKLPGRGPGPNIVKVFYKKVSSIAMSCALRSPSIPTSGA